MYCVTKRRNPFGSSSPPSPDFFSSPSRSFSVPVAPTTPLTPPSAAFISYASSSYTPQSLNNTMVSAPQTPLSPYELGLQKVMAGGRQFYNQSNSGRVTLSGPVTSSACCQLANTCNIICTLCSNTICESCEHICESCQESFCHQCSVTDHDLSHPREFCMSCHQDGIKQQKQQSNTLDRYFMSTSMSQRSLTSVYNDIQTLEEMDI